MLTLSHPLRSIEDDILNLMDEVNLDEFLREMSDAIDDPEKLSLYIREKTTIAVERFLVSAVGVCSLPCYSFYDNITYVSRCLCTELPSKNVNPGREA